MYPKDTDIIVITVVLVVAGVALGLLIFLSVSTKPTNQNPDDDIKNPVAATGIEQGPKKQKPVQANAGEKKALSKSLFDPLFYEKNITNKDVPLKSRLKAIEKLAKLAAKDDKAFALLVKLTRERRYTQKFVVEALGKTGRTEATALLQDFIAYKRPGVAVYAARALAQLGGTKSVAILMDGFSANANRTDGYGEEVRNEIVLSLSKLQAVEAAGVLGAELNAEASIVFKKLVAQALGEIGSTDGLPYLIEYRNYLYQHEPEKEEMSRSVWEQTVETVDNAIEKIQEGR